MGVERGFPLRRSEHTIAKAAKNAHVMKAYRSAVRTSPPGAVTPAPWVTRPITLTASASPIGPPICLEVLMSPEATPSSPRSAPPSAAMFDAVAERAPPTLARRSAGRTTDRYSEVSEILENERTPTASEAMATTSTGRAP